ncbi:MAG: DUF4259 domain-containing protein [Anaerolineales bacterium]|jgi:hypothetical protein
MGAWDIGSFDNDEALDWVYELEKANDFSILEKSFETVIDQKGDSPDASDCTIALCAAEVVASLLDNPASDVPDEVLQWIEDKPEPSSELIKIAVKAIKVILDDSELKELWLETDEYQDWVDNVKTLIENLTEE